MKSLINKRKLPAIIAIILLLTSITLVTLQVPVKAEVIPGTEGGTPDTQSVWSTTIPQGETVNWTFNPVAYLSITPNPVGIGQFVLVNMWSTPPPAANRYLAGFTVTFIKPDGTEDVIGPMHSYVADGTCWFEYIVDQVGTWKAKFDFPGQFFPAGLYRNGVINGTGPVVGFMGGAGSRYDAQYYKPASTGWQNFTVQNELVNSWYSPLPTDYWTRPISLNNREWNVIAGNYPWGEQYLGGGMSGAPRYLGPYITSSSTGHIVWKRQDAFPVGIIGAEAGIYGNKASATTPSVIFEGRCYATQTVQWYNGSFLSCAVSYDLRTGQMYYMNPTAAPFYGMTPSFIEYTMGTSLEVVGGGETNTVTGALWTISGSGSNARLYRINPLTGAIMSNYTALSGTYHNGYVISFQNLGNSSKPNYRIVNWTIAGTNATYLKVVSNISSVFGSLGQVDWQTSTSISQGRFVFGSVDGGRLTGYSLLSGQLLYNFTTEETPFNPGTAVADQGKYFCVMENRFVECFDAPTGKLLWKSPETEYPWGDFWGYSQASAYGLFLAFGYAGIYAFDWDTGAIVWHYAASAPAYESPYTFNTSTVYSFTGTPLIADGKLYIDNNEHTPSAPYTRGWGFYCINMTDGKLIWKLDEPMVAGAMADGYTTASDGYRGTMYVFGKGKSATTVQAPLTAINQGQSVVITGTVTDLSAAQPGAACVSEESMGAYMSYLHLQSQLPSSCTGVPVSIDAIDPNGNYIHIATVTSDIAGTYSCMWKPDNVGKYTVTATFAGSPAYGSSWAETAVGIVEAATTATPAPTATITMPPFETYFIGTAAVIVIAIAVATILLLRKRP